MAGGGDRGGDRRERGRVRAERWPAVALSNHDQPRHAGRFADPDRDAIARAAAVLLLTLRGTPFLYYGEEIALGNIRVPRKEIVDPPARRYWPLPLWWNRDGCRSPMPWTGEPNGGFTTGQPWLRLAPDHAIRNVAAQAADPGSVLSTYRRLLALRRTLPALQVGSFRWVVRARESVLAYRRDAAGEVGPRRDQPRRGVGVGGARRPGDRGPDLGADLHDRPAAARGAGRSTASSSG